MAFIERNGIVLHYEWLFNHCPQNIVCINSLGTDLSIWKGVVKRIGRNFNVLLFDKRGHGLSSTIKGELQIDDYADDVICLMDHLGIDKTHVIGLSIGGMITYSLASRYPDRFERLIFSNTGAKLGTAESWNARIQQIQQAGIESMSEAIIERWLSEDYRKNHKAETTGYTNMLERNTVLGYTQACAAIRDADFNPVVPIIRHPSMFVGGSEDKGTTPELVRENAQKLNAKRIEIIEGVGHLPCLEKPTALAELILEFCDLPNTSSYEKGMQVRRSVLGDNHVDRAEANKTDFDQDFQEYIVHAAWGSIWSRPQLSKRERSMITIALLAALGHDEELAMHIRASQNTGASIEDVKEVLLHVGVYAGVPVTNGAMKIAKQVFKEFDHEKND